MAIGENTARKAAKAATAAKVKEAAARLFRERGYEAVKVRDIVDAVGMSTGALFGNYEGKADLYQQAMGKPAPDVVGLLQVLAHCEYSPAWPAAAAREMLAALVGEG